MSLLAAAKKPQNEPLIVTICGNPGSGKTSLAASFPKPFLIRTTGEAVPRDLAEKPEGLDEVQKAEGLFEQLMALVNEEHDYQTVIIDSVTGLEALFTADVIEKDGNNPKSINQALGGWGAGRAAVASQHARVRRAAEALRKRRGMNVVFVAHADITRIDPPDAEGYNAYTLRLNDKSMSPYVDSVDVVGFVKQHTIVMGEDGKKKAITTGDRILTCYMTPASCAKNRLGITEDIEFVQGENPLAPYLSAHPQPDKTKRKAKPEPEPVEEVNEEEKETDA
jgi:hypothetical protein